MGFFAILKWVRRLTPAAGLSCLACGQGETPGEALVLPHLCAAEIAAGAFHSCARATDGRIWCWGSNEYGQLTGSGYSKAVTTPRAVTGLAAPAVRVSAGCRNTCAELQDGSLWCWGSNKSGQLGTSTSATASAVPVRIEGIQGPLRSVAMNCITEQGLNWELPPVESHYICAVKSDGSTWCWGAGRHGIFGDGQLEAVPSVTPVRVQGLDVDAAQVSAGQYHACARAGGAVVCWGANGMGGVGPPAASEVLPPTAVSGLPPVVDVAVGANNTCAVGDDGSVWCWGGNEIGQSGTGMPLNPSTVHPPAQVAVPGKALRVVAGLTSCALVDDGSIYCWGANHYGELGIGTMSKKYPPPNGTSTPMQSKVPVKAVSIASTGNHICIASDRDEVWCWGYNASGELGSGVVTQIDGIPTPVKVLPFCSP